MNTEQGLVEPAIWTATEGYRFFPAYINLTGNRLAVRGPEVDGKMGAYVVVQLPDEAIEALRTALSPQSDHIRELEEALTPSGDTKAAYHGEFKFDVPLDGYDEEGEPLEGSKSVYVPWDTVKQIMAAIRAHAAALHTKGTQA